MNNFYYTVVFNDMHPLVKGIDTSLRTIFSSDVVEVKAKSKHFMGFNETMESIAKDFSNRVKKLYHDDGLHKFHALTVMNPSFVTGEIGALRDTAAYWETDCCATLFYCELEETEEGEKPSGTWIVKYEIHVQKDDIDIAKNGEYASAFLNLENLPVSHYH
jgi:hypothetical protein